MSESFSVLQSKTAGSVTIKQSVWLQAFAVNMQQGILLSDANMIVTYINEQFCNLFSIKQTPDFFINKTIMDVYTAIDNTDYNATELAYKANDFAANKTAVKQQIKLNNKDIQLSYQPLVLEDNFIGHLWMYSDETENTQQIQKAEEQKNFLESVFSQLPFGVSVLSPAAQYLFVNKAEEADEELRKWMIGKNDLQYFSRNNKQSLSAEKRKYYFDKAIEENAVTEWEEIFTETDGTKNNFIRNYIPVHDEAGKIIMILSTAKNINKQKETETQLEQSEKKFRDLFTQTKAIICTHDMNGSLLSANPALCNLLGYEEEEIKGRNIRDCLPENEKENFETVYLREINNDRRSDGLFKVFRKSGEAVYLLYQNYVVEEGSQEPYVVGFAQDITQRILTEKKLTEAQKETQELVKSKEKFLASMSHEIRTPMNGIIGISSLLQKTTLSGEQKFYLNIIEESAQKLLKNINQIQESTNEIIPAEVDDLPEEASEIITQSVPVSENEPETKSINEMAQTQTLIQPVKTELAAESSLGKLHVLLAEDNDINQVLAKNILKHWGFTSKTVENGEEVLKALESENFDVILMDIQMPHKSGIEVTKEIRQLKDDVKRNIPVIALTAFSIRGEEKKYYEAGMDACLTKPFKEKELYEAISKVLIAKKLSPEKYQYIHTPEKAETLTGAEEKTIEVANEKIYDLSYLRGIQGSSADLVNKLIEIFIRTVPPATKEMMYAAKNSDWENVSKLAHKVKSSINTMGIHSLKNDIKFVEEASAQKQDLEEVSLKIINVDSIVSVAAQQLQEELNMHYAVLN